MPVTAPKKTEVSQFAKRLRSILEEREWTQEHLARAADLTHAAIRKLVTVKGGAQPTLETARKIAQALGMTLDELVKGT